MSEFSPTVALNITPLPVSLPYAAGVPVVARVSVGVIAVTLATADPNRTHLIIHNENGTLFIKLGPNCTSVDYTYRLTANVAIQIDFKHSEVISAVKLTGVSFVQVTSVI